MKLTKRERELLKKSIEQTERVLEKCKQDSLATGDPLGYSDEIEQCEVILKVLIFVLGGG